MKEIRTLSHLDQLEFVCFLSMSCIEGADRPRMALLILSTTRLMEKKVEEKKVEEEEEEEETKWCWLGL